MSGGIISWIILGKPRQTKTLPSLVSVPGASYLWLVVNGRTLVIVVIIYNYYYYHSSIHY